MKNQNLCSNCNSELDESHKKVGLCKICVKIELEERKTYFRHSLIGGIVFAAIAFGFIMFVKARYVGYDGKNFVVFFSTFFFTPGMGDGLFASIAGLSLRAQCIVYAICFIIPFGRFVEYEMRGEGMANLSIALLKLILAVISGPFVLLFNLYRLIRLLKHAPSD